MMYLTMFITIYVIMGLIAWPLSGIGVGIYMAISFYPNAFLVDRFVEKIINKTCRGNNNNDQAPEKKKEALRIIAGMILLWPYVITMAIQTVYDIIQETIKENQNR